MIVSRLILFLFLVQSFVGLLHAAPHPLVGGLQDSLKGRYFSDHGFSFSMQDGFTEVRREATLEAPNQWEFVHQEDKDIKVSVNFQKVKKISLSSYAKKWIKDYSYLGFNLLSTRTLDLAGKSVLLIDLVHPKKQRQLRQFLYLNEDKAITLTCSHQYATSFADKIKPCYDVARSVSWL